MTRLQQILGALRIGRIDLDSESLFDFKKALGVPSWIQVCLVVSLFVLTVALTNAEYRASGTVFGFPGPAFYVLLAPVIEELVFRGWILEKLVRRHSNVGAILISSALFGVLHFRNIYWLEDHALIRTMLFTGLVAGPCWGYLALRSRSVWPAVVAHYLNNLAFFA